MPSPKTKSKSVIKTSSKSQDLLNHLVELKENGFLCDIQIILQGSCFIGHACIFSLYSYFLKDFFKLKCAEKSNWEDHWCARKPLVVDLDQLLTNALDRCVTCVSTIVDFIYQREIVVLEGHFQHFTNIVNFLQVFELFPMCRKYYAERNSEPSGNEHLCKQSLDSLHASKNNDGSVNKLQIKGGLNKSSINEENHNGCSLKNKPNETINLILNCEIAGCSDVNREETAVDNNCDCQTELLCPKSANINEQVEPNNSNSQFTYQVKAIAEDHSYILKEDVLPSVSKINCEFDCCNKDENVILPSLEKYQKQKILCEICLHTTTSVKKMIKHMNSYNHLETFCPICKSKHQSVSDLKDHLKDHLNSKPYLCQICNKRIKAFENYKLHLKVHCRKKPFCCQVCQKSFSRRQNLVNHVKGHEKNYVCTFCNYSVTVKNSFESHLLMHKTGAERQRKHKGVEETEKVEEVQSSSDKTKDVEVYCSKPQLWKKFTCKVCDKGFTQKKNLIRHTQLTHFSSKNFKCSKCVYTTKRTDLLKHHMLKHHNYLLKGVKEITKMGQKREMLRKSKQEDDQTKIVGVMIPIQLVSTKDSSTFNAFAVKTCKVDDLKNLERVDVANENGSVISNHSETYVSHHPQSLDTIHSSLTESRNNTNIVSAISEQNLQVLNSETESSSSLAKDNEVYPTKDRFSGYHSDISSSPPPENLTHDKSPNNQPNEILTQHSELNSSNFVLNEKDNCTESLQYKSDILTNGNFFLNEATGEFLSGNNFVNLQMLNASCMLENAGNSSMDMNDPFCSILLNDNSKGVSVFDLEKDMPLDDFHSNPQTPQTNLFELDDTENILSWNCPDNSFCSTWVLNETTGELNLVSFSVKPLKSSDESKLNQCNETFSPSNNDDDDETALFLNEGTGDLSIIYFNLKHSLSEKLNQEIPDNISEHSNEADEDLLNEKFFQATASFMAREENETFLNELTGEFDSAQFDNEHFSIQDNQIAPSESYLNEETGEISWNVLDKNIGSDFFTNSDNFKYDFDDSLNCDDIDPFPESANSLSDCYHLAESKNDWQPLEDTCDTLLNECTGELVKKKLY